MMMMTSIRSLAAALLLLGTNSADALSLKPNQPQPRQTANTMDRRQALGTTIAAAFGSALLSPPQPAMAANAGPTPDELKRIQVGYQQITELLNNFEEATTTCRENGGECKRDAEPIRE